MSSFGNFPFGNPVHAVTQKDQSRKKVFVLGVYASAVHAKWIWNDGKSLISAMAVASEPEIFWDGNTVEAQNIISGIKLPENTGSLILPNGNLNGPSGKVLDEMYLKPLGFTRNDVWLCDLVPYSCMNGRQEKALKTKYDPKS